MSASLLAWLNGAAAIMLTAAGASYVLFGDRLKAAVDRDRRDGLGPDVELDRLWYEFAPRTWGFFMIGLGLLFAFLWSQS